MKHFKLFFACMLMLLFGFGQMWADTPAAAGTTLFSEDFSSYAANDVPSGSVTTGTGRVVYGDANVTYTCTNGDGTKPGATKIYAEALATGTSPEILVGKYGTGGSTGGTFSITGIPSGGAQEITVSFKQNKQKLKVEPSGTGYTGSVDAKPSDAGTVSFDIAVADGADATFTLTFSAYSSNVRVDDIEITVKTAGEGAGTPTCANPTFSPAAGTFYGSQEITLATTTPDASIYYTLDNSTPSSSNGTLYENPFTITETKTVKAIAVKDGATDSEVVEATYTAGAAVTSYVIDFETNNLAAYVNWDFVNIACATATITAHGGTYYGNTDGKATASITTKAKYAAPGDLTFWTSKESGNTTASSWIAQVSDDGSVWTDVETYDATTGSKGTWTERTADLSAYTNVYVRISYSGSTAVRAIDDISLTTASATPKAKTPTFETGDENFVTSTSVTLACETSGAKIYYTTNGDAPTISSTLYEGAIDVSVTTTIKAIAVADGYDNSAVAEKTFTKVEALGSLAALLEEITTTENTFNVNISDWIVTGAISNRAWIANAENTKGILLYKSGHGFTAGKKLNGVVVGTKAKLYQGYPELTTLLASEVAISDAAEVTPRETTLAAIVSGYNAEQGTVVKLTNVTYIAGTGFSDGINTVALNTTLYTPTMVDGATYDIIGVVRYDNGPAYSIMPRSVDDVEQTSGGGLPEVDGLAELKAEATGASYLVNLTDAVVTLVSGNNAFIEDATAGALIFYSGHGLVAGDKLNGQYEVTTATYQGKFEITAMEAQTGAEKTSGAEIPVTTLTIAQLNANFAANESKRIKIVGANVTDAISGSDRNGAINDGAALAVYAGVASTITLAENDNVDIIGYPGFHNSDQQLTVWAQTDITVNVKDDPELSYSPASVNLTVGDALSAPTFNNPHTLSPITYNTNNDAVATVDEYGAIALAGGTGTAVITASYAGDATYNAGNATFTINVYDPAAAPKNVVIIAEYNTKFYAMSTALNTTSNYCPAIEVEKDGGNIVVTSAEDKAAIQWSMAVDEGVSPKTASFQAGVDEYLKGTSGGAGLSFATTPFDWEWDDTNNCYIVSGSTRGFFYKNDGIFKNYALSNLSNAAYAGVEIIEIDPANIIISSKVSAELAYDPATLTITQGDAWSAPTLGYVVGFDGLAAITYASDNEAVATVTDAGVISLAGGTGTATITATFAGNANYLAGNATYAITVNAPAATPTGTTYTKVTSTAEITDGEYLIVYETTSVAFDGSLTTLDAEGNSVAVVISADQIAGTTVIDAATFTIDVTAGTLQSASGKYIGVSSNSNGLKTSDDAATYTNTFSIDGDGNAVILANFEGSTMKLRYNPSTSAGNLRFRYYKNDGQQAIQLYKKDVVTPPTPTPVEVRSGLEIGRHYTICLEKNITNIDGATFWNLQYKNAGNTEVYLVEETAPEAGKPYIIQATKTTLNVVYGDEEENTPVENGALRGTFTGFDVDAFAALTGNVYLLIENAIRPRTTGNYLAGHRAYVLFDELQNVPSAGFAPGKKVKAMPLQGQTPTGCENINASETPVKMIIDGQMFILRGEKMYDATGRLVK